MLKVVAACGNGMGSSQIIKMKIEPKLQLQVEHFGKMAATSGCIKVVEKCIE